MDDSNRSTIGSDVAEHLRRDIVDGRLPPGSKLKYAELQKKYGASMGALREALVSLTADGIVVADAGRGFRVAEVSEEDLRDLMAVRLDIERRAIEDSVRNGDDDWEARVLASWHKLSKVSGLAFPERFLPDKEWIKRHRDFHDALVSACRSPRILQFRAVLYNQAERYRMLSIRHGPRLQDAEHEQLRDAALARDSARAGELLAQHIRDSATFVLDYAPQLNAATGGKARLSS